MKTLAEALEEIKKLKCCGNCGHTNYLNSSGSQIKIENIHEGNE